MNNILFYLTPKCECAYLAEDDTLRRALDKMEACRFTSIPILTKKGSYLGTMDEGDLLYFIKNRYALDVRAAEDIPITVIDRKRDYLPISISAKMEDLLEKALRQNFVPVCDDDDRFIGIVTRQEVMKYFAKKLKSCQQSAETNNTFRIKVSESELDREPVLS